MITKIYGPPGCGKTTRLLNQMETALSNGVNPNKIGFFSFTNKAADEAKERAIKKFPHLEEKDFFYFKTLHSLAYHLIGGSKVRSCMDNRDWKVFGKIVGMTFTPQHEKEWDDLVGHVSKTKGDKLRKYVDLARLREVSLAEIHKVACEDNISLFELKHFVDTLEAYKKENGVIDFCDMLELGCKAEHKPCFDVLFIDEAQDLSKLQWQFIELLINEAKEVYIAGDDDQAIFNFAGADISVFNAFPGEKEVLGQSYRIPLTVHKYATGIRKLITGSMEKEWNPTEHEGSVKFHGWFEPTMIGMDKGNWLVLTRTNGQITPIVEELIEKGYFFEAKCSPIRTGTLWAIDTWEKLRSGSSQPIPDIVNMLRFMSTKTCIRHGSKEKIANLEGELNLFELQEHYGMNRISSMIWHIALDKLEDREIGYYIDCLKKGEKLRKTPRITVSTIHGAKGGESDNVLLFTDMGRYARQEYDKDPVHETRVWYVAVTRAKHNLHIVLPYTKLYFEPLINI